MRGYWTIERKPQPRARAKILPNHRIVRTGIFDEIDPFAGQRNGDADKLLRRQRCVEIYTQADAVRDVVDIL